VLTEADLHGGTEPDLPEEAACWQTDGFCQYALFAAVGATASRLRTGGWGRVKGFKDPAVARALQAPARRSAGQRRADAGAGSARSGAHG
jgi:hypothetical protein